MINVQMEIEQYKDNEVALHQQLAKLVTHAEKTMADKNTWEKLVCLTYNLESFIFIYKGATASYRY